MPWLLLQTKIMWRYDYFEYFQKWKEKKKKIYRKYSPENSEIFEAEIEIEMINNDGYISTNPNRLSKTNYLDLNSDHPLFEIHIVRKEPSILSYNRAKNSRFRRTALRRFCSWKIWIDCPVFCVVPVVHKIQIVLLDNHYGMILNKEEWQDRLEHSVRECYKGSKITML